jgi:hypothetical protein
MACRAQGENSQEPILRETGMKVGKRQLEELAVRAAVDLDDSKGSRARRQARATAARAAARGTGRITTPGRRRELPPH